MPTLRDHLHSSPFTLALSAGFFGFYAYAGVLRALLDPFRLHDRIAAYDAAATRMRALLDAEHARLRVQ